MTGHHIHPSSLNTLQLSPFTVTLYSTTTNGGMLSYNTSIKTSLPTTSVQSIIISLNMNTISIFFPASLHQWKPNCISRELHHVLSLTPVSYHCRWNHQTIFISEITWKIITYMNNNRRFDLIFALVFAMIPQMGVLGTNLYNSVNTLTLRLPTLQSPYP